MLTLCDRLAKTKHGTNSGMKRLPTARSHPVAEIWAFRSSSMSHVAITGASSGFGAALARVYGRHGWRLSLIARDAGRLEAVAAACRADGAEAGIHTADVTDAAAMDAVVTACDCRQPVDLLIANAGIGGRDALAPDSGEPGPVARRILTTNVLGVVNTVTPLLPRLVERRRGHIAIISSLAGLTGLPASPAYSASKAAARAYGDGLRRLVAPSGVRVSVVCPGFIDTPFAASLPFHLPFLWSADRAALHVARALARGRREIQFPWQLAVALRVVAALPAVIADRILTATARAPR
jgi:short-subunit dehydrogenase